MTCLINTIANCSIIAFIIVTFVKSSRPNVAKSNFEMHV